MTGIQNLKFIDFGIINENITLSDVSYYSKEFKDTYVLFSPASDKSTFLLCFILDMTPYSKIKVTFDVCSSSKTSSDWAGVAVSNTNISNFTADNMYDNNVVAVRHSGTSSKSYKDLELNIEGLSDKYYFSFCGYNKQINVYSVEFYK